MTTDLAVIIPYIRHHSTCDVPQRISPRCTCGLADAIELAFPERMAGIRERGGTRAHGGPVMTGAILAECAPESGWFEGARRAVKEIEDAITEMYEAPHHMVFHQIAPGDDTKGRWEMYCSCGAWQHGTKAEVERTAEMHRTPQTEEGVAPDA